MASVRLHQVTKRYEDEARAAVDAVSLEIADGELFVLLGPSGCGKSTLLKLIAGLEEPSEGELHIGDRLVNYVSPGRRDVAMVFQSYALYPHMTARENIRFPLRMAKTPRVEADARVGDAAATLELERLLDRKVGALSGGERQRVAVARALVRDPAVLLMDEPLSNLDALLRMHTREELLRLHRAVPGTIVYVTHDQVEAMTMGDRIAVMEGGHLAQVGSAMAIYDQPATRFVAGFIGAPPMSLLDGHLAGEDGALRFRSDGVDLALPDELVRAAFRGDHGRDGWTLGIRPEAVELRSVNGGPPWRVEVVEHLGADCIVGVRYGSSFVRSRLGSGTRSIAGAAQPIIDAAHHPTVDAEVELALPAAALRLFTPSGRNVQA